MLPTKRRLPSAFLLEKDKKKVLLDCGHGALARLTELEIDPREIDVVFISHSHADYMGDAFNLVYARWVGDNYEDKKHKSLIFLGAKTLQERFKKWREVFDLNQRKNIHSNSMKVNLSINLEILVSKLFP